MGWKCSKIFPEEIRDRSRKLLIAGALQHYQNWVESARSQAELISSAAVTFSQDHYGGPLYLPCQTVAALKHRATNPT